jgi:hypothetical protein
LFYILDYYISKGKLLLKDGFEKEVVDNCFEDDDVNKNLNTPKRKRGLLEKISVHFGEGVFFNVYYLRIFFFF